MPKICTIVRIGLSLLILFTPFVADTAIETQYSGDLGTKTTTIQEEMSNGFPGSGSGSLLTAWLKAA